MFLKFSYILFGTVLGSCVESDVALWRGSQIFSDNVAKFALLSFGQSQGTVSRLRAEYSELSEGCAVCFGATVACGTSNCWKFCWRGHTSVPCVKCSEKFCRPNFVLCSGLTSEGDWPPPPTGVVTTTASPVVVIDSTAVALSITPFYGDFNDDHENDDDEDYESWEELENDSADSEDDLFVMVGNYL